MTLHCQIEIYFDKYVFSLIINLYRMHMTNKMQESLSCCTSVGNLNNKMFYRDE